MPRVFNEKFSSHNRAWLACRDGEAGAGHTQSDHIVLTVGPLEQHPRMEGKEQELLFAVPAQLHTSEAGRSCPHPGVSKGGFYLVLSTQHHSTETPAPCPAPGATVGHGDTTALPWEALLHRDTRDLPTALILMGTLGYHPSRTGSATASGIVRHVAFRRRDTRIHCKIMFSWSIYIKHEVKLKSPPPL